MFWLNNYLNFDWIYNKDNFPLMKSLGCINDVHAYLVFFAFI